MTTRRNDRHAALTDAVTRRESDWVDADGKRPIHDHDRGLLYDLGTMNRRRALGLLGGVGARGAGRLQHRHRGHRDRLLLLDDVERHARAAPAARRRRERRRHARPRCRTRPAAPTPADGSNGVNVLDDSGIVRSDIRSELRLVDDDGRRRPADHRADRPRRLDRRGPAGRGGLPLALRPRRQVLALLAAASTERELPARRPGDRRERHGDLHVDLSRPATRAAGRTSTSRSTPASPTRPSSGPIVKTSPDRAAPGGLRRRLRDRRLRSERAATSRRSRCRATTSSATTAASTRSRRCPATRRPGYTAALTVGV